MFDPSLFKNSLKTNFSPVFDILILQIKGFCLLAASAILNILGFLLIGSVGIFLIAGGWYCLYLVYKIVRSMQLTPIQTMKNLFNAIKNLFSTLTTRE